MNAVMSPEEENKLNQYQLSARQLEVIEERALKSITSEENNFSSQNENPYFITQQASEIL